MNRKLKLVILLILIVILALTVVVYFFEFKKINVGKAVIQSENKIVDSNNKGATNLDGKVRSINETQLYLELPDGSGKAININAKTPVVKKEGDAGNLSDLKSQDVVTVKTDKNDNALKILIKG